MHTMTRQERWQEATCEHKSRRQEGAAPPAGSPPRGPSPEWKAPPLAVWEVTVRVLEEEEEKEVEEEEEEPSAATHEHATLRAPAK